MASIRGPRWATTNGNESVTFRVVPAFESFRIILNHFAARFNAFITRLSRVCFAPSGDALKHFLGGDGLSFQFSQFVDFIPT
jgi:hypothetical protein